MTPCPAPVVTSYPLRCGISPIAVTKRDFLLKFARDRRSYPQWLFDSKKRFGLCVLDYVVTCNHIHLLVKDSGEVRPDGLAAQVMHITLCPLTTRACYTALTGGVYGSRLHQSRSGDHERGPLF